MRIVVDDNLKNDLFVVVDDILMIYDFMIFLPRYNFERGFWEIEISTLSPYFLRATVNAQRLSFENFVLN